MSTPQNIYWRRRLTLLGVLALAIIGTAVLIGSGGGQPERTAADDAAVPPPPVELPRGGRSILPEFRVVAYYGAPQSRELGALGIGSPRGAARRLARQGRPYGTKRRPVLPALELITVIANADPGDDGMYRSRQRDAVIRRYLRAARRAKAILLLDLQPGRSDFFTEATRLEKWLKEPDVSLALDPEWRAHDSEVPGQVIGHVGAREVNATSAWLAQLVAKHDLPEKLFVLHQFTFGMITNRAAVVDQPGLATVIHVDGFGGRSIKQQKYQALKSAPPFANGLKLFHDEDTDMFTPPDVLAMVPAPDLVTYQ